MNFFSELKRRNVYKVAAAYAVVAWLLIQAASILLPTFEAPSWVMKVIVLAVVLGFPIAVILAWAFELTPEGIKRTEDVAVAKRPKNRTWIYVVAVGVVLSIGLFLLGRYTGRSTASAARTEAAASSSIPQKSIAVLAFQKKSADADTIDPFLDSLRDDPRFDALAEKIVPARAFRAASK